MEPITNQLQKTVNQLQLTNLQAELQGLTQVNRDEKDILSLKYKSIPFGLMTLNDRVNWATALLSKIHVITGWVIPDDPLMDVIVDQFEKKLNESYPLVNPDEVEYAFRSQGTVIKDWGKQMNLALIDEVMIPYMDRRLQVSRKEEQQKSKLMLPEKTEDISDEGMDKFWDATEELVSQGGYPVELIPPMLYDWMDKNGNILIDKNEKLKYIERATLVRHSTIAMEYEKNPYSIETKSALNDFNRMRETKKYSEAEHGKITDLAKKMVVYEMMKTKLSKSK